ncbi:MAG: HAMP domain-containing protein [Sulfurimonas sp.]|nr:HAMP domain-containing protein [Sulfurimonas sp.]
MSFRIKIISLILSVGLIPYIVIMVYSGNILRDKYYDNTHQEMQTQLFLNVERIDQYLTTLKRDMFFISRLDVMNDIFSKDVDRRIANLLEEKKRELKLDGNFHLIDKSGKILASSDAKMLFNATKITPFFSVDIKSPFDESIIGTLVLEFSLKNITNFFENSKDRHYYIILDKAKTLYKTDSFKHEIHVSKHLKSKQNIEIVLEQNQDVFLNLLKKYENWFVVTFVIGAFVIGIIALFFINRLIKPIIELSSVVEEITKKQDYSYQVKVYSNDEIGKLSSSFNKMIVGMSNILDKLKMEAKNRENLVEERAKNEMLEQLSTKLSRYLSPQVYESIFSGDQDVTLTSKRKKLTIFFSDIVNFTDTTDTMESEDLSELLNDYLNEMTIIALKYGATVDKYMGDSIMLFFGDPHSNGIKEDAVACVNMALSMRSRMNILHEKWREKGFSKLFQVRIGIHTGYCTVGNFGSKDRLEYTIIGSSVNLASRIETSANSDEILISEETKLLVSDNFVCKEVNGIIPKGLKRPIALYQVDSNLVKKDMKVLDIQKNGFKLSCNIQTLSLKDKDILREELSSLIKKL